MYEALTKLSLFTGIQNVRSWNFDECSTLQKQGQLMLEIHIHVSIVVRDFRCACFVYVFYCVYVNYVTLFPVCAEEGGERVGSGHGFRYYLH